MAQKRRSFLRAIAPPLALVAAIGVGGAAAFAFWPRAERRGLTPEELEWAQPFAEWMANDRTCARRGPPPPTERLHESWEIAGRACRGDAEWNPAWTALVRHASWTEELGSDASAESYRSADVEELAERVTGRPTPVFCWGEYDWIKINAEFSVLFPGAPHVIGFVEPVLDRIHVSRRVCDGLNPFLSGGGTATEADRSATAGVLTIVAHEAEHVRDRSASEAVVECRAVQRVRSLVTSRGRPERVANQVALHAWDVSYPRYDPVYGTPRCRNGGPLDLRPRDPRWP